MTKNESGNSEEAEQNSGEAMSQISEHFAYSLGISNKRVRFAEAINTLLAAIWGMIAYLEYGSDWFLFGFSLLMCGVRVGMSINHGP